MKKSICKSFLSAFLGIVLFAGLSTTSYAATTTGAMRASDWDELKKCNTIPGYYSQVWNKEGDTAHGFKIYTNSSKTVSLNRYTSTSPSVGTRITTWKNDPSDNTQKWLLYTTGQTGSKFFIVPYLDYDLFIEVYRTSSSSSADLIARLGSYQGNYYEDGYISGRIVSTVNDLFGEYLSLPARTTNGTTFPTRQLKISSSSTPVSDGNGTNKYCTWSSSGDIFYIGDAT